MIQSFFNQKIIANFAAKIKRREIIIYKTKNISK